MTNGELYENRLIDLGLGGLLANDAADFIAVRENGDLVLCESIPCHDCIFAGANCYGKRKAWIRSEAEPSRKGKI